MTTQATTRPTSTSLTRASLGLCKFFFIVPILLLLTASTLRASTVTALWNANTESDIAGYKLSYGTTSGVYTTTIDVGNVTSYVVPVLGGQTYYFVVQAYDTGGLLSAYSTEVPFTVAPATMVSPAAGSTFSGSSATF